MAIKSWPYVSIEGDRKITAADFAQGYDLISASGVVPGFLNTLAPSKVSGTLNVIVDTGAALVGGRWYVQDESEQVTLDAGSAQPRIDIIAVESNSNTPARESRLVVVKGTPATEPTAPDLTNDSAISQIELCRIFVPANSTTLGSATMTDTRSFVSGRHTHEFTEIAGLQNALNGKAASTHTHSISAVSGLEAVLNGKEPTLSSDQKRKITISPNNPSGGDDGDIWIKLV